MLNHFLQQDLTLMNLLPDLKIDLVIKNLIIIMYEIVYFGK